MVKGKMKSLLVILAVGTLAVMGVAALIMFNLPQLPMSAVYLVMGMGVVEEILILCVTCYYRKHEDFNANVTNMQNVAFSRASRDIRTLMNSILNFSSPELIENYNPQEMLNSLTKINNAGLYLMTVVDDLMATYHVSDQQIVLKENPTTIENVFNPIVELVTERFISKNQVFDVEYINIDKFRYVLVDAPRVQQIVMNLLTNANKYTPEGGHILFRVEGVSGEGESLDITITVKDNGQGMSKRKLNNLFKADPKQTFDKGHYELGLAIVASLVKQMNGTISCTSQENQGSEFVVKFQWTYCHKNSFASTIRDFSVLRGKNILVVEDNEMNAEITKAILEKKGMDARDSSYTNPDGTVRFHGNFRRTNTLGWVPILEPINKMPVEEHIQEKMVFLVPGAVCIGTPVESSNYDIVVCMSNENIATFYPSACPGKGIWWDQIGDNRFVLDKTQIIHCQTL